jgi:hypothetical protein
VFGYNFSAKSKTAKQALEEFPELQPLKQRLSLPASPFLLQLT